MVTRHVRGKITWVDLESPTHEELDGIMAEFSVDERVEEEIISPTPYPLVITSPRYLYLILHFPTADPASGTRNQEVDFIVGKNFLITARYEVIDSIHNLHRVFEAEELLGLPEKTGSDELLERIMRRLYGAIRDEMEHAAHILERIEEDMFAGKERDTIHAIADIGRVLLRFETALVRHEEPLDNFLQNLSLPTFFGKNFGDNALHIEAERSHVADLVRSYRAAATELRATNDSLLSASQNEITKMLSAIIVLASPITVLSAMFSMNTETPFQGNPDAFWIIFIGGLFGSLILYLTFKIKRWL